MIAFLQALAPVILLVAVGWGVAERRVIGDKAWRSLERLVYFLFFPVLIISVLAKASFDKVPVGMALTLVIAQATLGLTGLLARGTRGTQQSGNPRKGSIIQSNVRWNTFIGLSIAGAMFGADGLALMALAVAILTSFANILSVWALTHYSENKDSKKPWIWWDMSRNPLILACIAGIVLNILGITPTGIVEQSLDLIGQISIALGLLTVGAAIDVQSFRRTGPTTLLWSAVRLLGLPAAAFTAALFLDLSEIEMAIVIIATATPTASSGYILARQLGGDAKLSANLITVQTVAAIITMPAIYTLYLSSLR
ncbi:MAG: AEC family transporter [Parasphingorhabdus sp.]